MKREYQFDVAVAGAGTAGTAAAVGAALAGAKTVLIERSPYPGGEATHSGVAAFCGFYTCGGDPVKAVAGVGEMILKRNGRTGSLFDQLYCFGNRKQKY